MAEIDEIYSSGLFELSAVIPRTTRLAHPDASATAHSKLCGSTVSVDLKMEGGKVADYGQTVKACLLGQAAASVMGREIVYERSRDQVQADIDRLDPAVREYRR